MMRSSKALKLTKAAVSKSALDRIMIILRRGDGVASL
jgi:hypothetical protein